MYKPRLRAPRANSGSNQPGRPADCGSGEWPPWRAGSLGRPLAEPKSPSDRPLGSAPRILFDCSENSRDTLEASGLPVNCLATMPSTIGAR